MPLRYPVVALAVGALAVAACGTPPAAAPALPPVTPIMIPPALAASDGDALVGRAWAWQRTQFADGKFVVPDAAERYTLEFQADGRVQLRADCNRGGARFDAGAGRTLTLSPAAVTKMGCPAGSQGSEFLHELSQVSAYLFASGNLVLTLRADAGSMLFAPAAR
ncbi:MAG TPA: META domain-containing protein [Casimicrobiaceae bacterium]|nr:META domain-containing protein [Casimicrobiaceae bacterium]